MGPIYRQRTDAARLRSDVAVLALDLGWLRVERALLSKYREDQPREPAGRPGGGRWVSDGQGAADGGATRSDETVTEDGSRVLTIRIRPNASSAWDAQHTVVSPGGERTVFETSGWTQTSRDGETGTVLGRTTLTARGVEPEAFPQSVFRQHVLSSVAARVIEAIGTLFAALSARNSPSRKAIFVAPASRYEPGQGLDDWPIWVDAVSQHDLDVLCPRNGEVQALADQVAASVKATGQFPSSQDFGNEVHRLIAIDVNSRGNPDFIAERTYDMSGNSSISHGTRGSVRLDVLERVGADTVCVYDHKTGDRGLRTRYVTKVLPIVYRNFPTAKRIIVIEIRPKP